MFDWGESSYGELGHGDLILKLSPKRVEALIDVNVKQVACGYRHTAVCTENGLVYTFGSGYYGELGHGGDENKRTSSPVEVQSLKGKHIIQVQCGASHTMALTSSGYVFTWGKSAEGRLGYGNSELISFSIPCLVEGLREHNVIQIANCHHCAVLVDPNPSTIRQSQQASFNNKEHSDVVFMVEHEPLSANVMFSRRRVSISQPCFGPT